MFGTIASEEPVSLFIAYSHTDDLYRSKLGKHLEALRRTCNVQPWHDRRIVPGQHWETEIVRHLEHDPIILPLISADFISSDYCYGIEMKRAMERHELDDAIVIPVILRPCDWHSLPIGRLQAVPRNGKPVSTWSNRDEAMTDIVRGIRLQVDRLRGIV
jgi:hypothetical protein